MPQPENKRVEPTASTMRGPMRGHGPVGVGIKGRGAKNVKKTLLRLFKYMSRYRVHFVVVVILILLSSAAGVQGSLFLQTLIDDYIIPLTGTASPDFSPMLRATLIMAGIYLVGVIASFAYNQTMVIIAQGVQKNIRDHMFSHMQSLPVKFFDTHTHGDLMSLYTNDTDTLRQLISQSLPQLISSSVTVIFVFAAMLSVSIPLTVLVTAMIFLMVKILAKVGGASAVHFSAQQKSLGQMNGYIEDMTHGQKVIKVFCYEQKAKDRFDVLNEELFAASSQANKLANSLMPIMMNLGNIQYVLIAIVGGLLAVNGISGLTLGGIASFLQLSRAFSGPIGQVSQQINSVVMALAGAERIFGLLDEQPEADSGYVTLVNAKYSADGTALEEADQRTGLWAWRNPREDGAVTYHKLEGDVRFSHVDFAYKEGENVLHDVTLFAKPGQKVAFVGATGAGKTTITNLINRFYDLADGNILYDGIDVNKIRKSDLRRSLGVVLQDTNLFTGTVLENIRYGRPEAADEEVFVAARLAGADGFIKRLPEGYNTVIDGDGSGLSQGQRQLISIARAAVADPPVMILDEATSSIDTRTEAIIQQGMDFLMSGRTTFVIAHRLSTVRNSDVIMVLELGHIIERGSHRELIAQGGKYYQLYTGAFELD